MQGFVRKGWRTRWLVAGLAVLVLAAGLVVARRVLTRKKAPVVPAEVAFAAILTDYKAEQEKTARPIPSSGARTPRREDLPLAQEAEFTQRFLDFARAYPQDPRAVDALVWVCTRPDEEPGIGALQEQALDLLTRRYLAELRPDPFLPRVAFTARGAGGEKLLRAVAEKAPDRTVRGLAELYLGAHFNVRADKAFYAERPEAARLRAEAEKQLARAAAEYPDIRLQETPLTQVVKEELANLRTLGLGRPAPDTEGLDTAGKHFKLSDYKGKVVLLSFWGFW
jgi:hypothetical protein